MYSSVTWETAESETLNDLKALNEAVTDEKLFFNHLKLTNMTTVNDSNNGSKVYKTF